MEGEEGVVHAALAYPSSYNLAHPPEIQKALSPSDTLSRLLIPLAVWPLLLGPTLSSSSSCIVAASAILVISRSPEGV